MGKLLPNPTDKLNSPDHAFMHRVVTVDDSAPEQSIYVDGAGDIQIPEKVITPKLGSFGSLIKTDPAKYLFYETDFLLGSTIASWAYGVTPWQGIAVGAGTLSIAGGTAKHPGQHIIKSHASTVNSGWTWLISSVAFLIAGGEEAEFIFQYISPAAGVNTIRIGFHDTADINIPVDGAWLDIVAGVLTGRTSSNSSASATASNFNLTSATWYRVKITLNANASLVTFTLYSEAGTVLWTDTLNTNIPTGAGRIVGHGIIATNSAPGGTGQNIYTIDYMSILINRQLIR